MRKKTGTRRNQRSLLMYHPSPSTSFIKSSNSFMFSYTDTCTDSLCRFVMKQDKTIFLQTSFGNMQNNTCLYKTKIGTSLQNSNRSKKIGYHDGVIMSILNRMMTLIKGELRNKYLTIVNLLKNCLDSQALKQASDEIPQLIFSKFNLSFFEKS